MKFTKNKINACCGKTVNVFRFESTTDKNLMSSLINFGYQEAPYLTKCGVLYLENDSLVLTGNFTGNSLQIKCKSSNCDSELEKLESYLTNLA